MGYHPNKDPVPPSVGWKVPYDGPVDPSFTISTGSGSADKLPTESTGATQHQQSQQQQPQQQQQSWGAPPPQRTDSWGDPRSFAGAPPQYYGPAYNAQSDML